MAQYPAGKAPHTRYTIKKKMSENCYKLFCSEEANMSSYSIVKRHCLNKFVEM
jgi:hypothetical protein